MTSFELLGAQTNLGPITLTLSGEATFDDYIFGLLKTGDLTSEQAKFLWTYSDGYKLTLSSTVLVPSEKSVHCLVKNYSAVQ